MPKLTSFELSLTTGQKGRVFGHVNSMMPEHVEALTKELERRFIEEDDVHRLGLLKMILARETLEVKVYPEEEDPQHLHAYVESSNGPLFACVLIRKSYLEQLKCLPEALFETACFQVIDVSVELALETWIRRIWPDAHVPRIELV